MILRGLGNLGLAFAAVVLTLLLGEVASRFLFPEWVPDQAERSFWEYDALLGWVNCTVRLAAESPFDGNQLLVDLAQRTRQGVADLGGDIAHLKMTLDAQDGTGTLSVVSVVGTDREPDVRESLLDGVDGGELVINLRAEADPKALEATVRAALASLSGVETVVEHFEQLRPGRPVPTHRLA